MVCVKYLHMLAKFVSRGYRVDPKIAVYRFFLLERTADIQCQLERTAVTFTKKSKCELFSHGILRND